MPFLHPFSLSFLGTMDDALVFLWFSFHLRLSDVAHQGWRSLGQDVGGLTALHSLCHDFVLVDGSISKNAFRNLLQR